MEIKGSATYAAAANQSAATEKTVETGTVTKAATQPAPSAVDSVTISAEALKLQQQEQLATTTADGDPPGWPPTPPTKSAATADGDPPGWPPTPEPEA